MTDLGVLQLHNDLSAVLGIRFNCVSLAVVMICHVLFCWAWNTSCKL